MNYEELVKALRCCADGSRMDCDACEYEYYDCTARLIKDAAAAIEELQAKLHAKESSAKRWRRLATDMADYVDAVRCGECKHYNAGFECLAEGYGIERDPDWFCADGERKVQDA